MRKAAIIVNPVAGQGKLASSVSKCAMKLRELDVDCLTLLTACPGDGIALARKAVDMHSDIVIAAGGDGTVNEIANGLAGSDIPMGILPIGTVNVLARELGIPVDPLQAIDTITDGTVKHIDLGRANGRYFTLMTGLGFDAEVVSTVLQPLKDILGASAYVLRGLEMLTRYQATEVSLEMPDQVYSARAFLVIVANSSTYTYRLKIAPYASYDDGLLDICVFERPIADRIGFMRQVVDVFANRHLSHEAVSYFRTPSVVVRSRPDVAVQIDGDAFGTTPVEITVSPRILPVMVPSEDGVSEPAENPFPETLTGPGGNH